MSSSLDHLTTSLVPQAQAALANLLAIAKTSNIKQLLVDFSTRTTRRQIVAVVLGYLAVVRLFRYRRETALRRKYGYFDRASLSRMTVTEAHEIIKAIASLEFPRFHALSLEFGLFKTYGVESISKLLFATRQLTDASYSPRRFEDTALLIDEFMTNPPTSKRANQAIARMNYLHSKYRKSGHISNDDLLYTLSVFVIEPPRFMRLYEWRPLNEMEYCAYGVFWKSIGDAMGIDYHGSLPGAETGWKDGVQFADEITAWAKEYEIKQMVPSATSAKPATALIPLMTYWVPAPMKPFTNQCIYSLLGDRVREAFLLPEPGITPSAVTHSAIALRRFYLRYLNLPRLREVRPLGEPDEQGRMSLNFSHGNYPFYVKPTMWNRWSPKAWAIWLYGGKLPGDNPGEYKPNGYTIDEVGPVNREKLGKQEMAEDVDKMMRGKRGGCPF